MNRRKSTTLPTDKELVDLKRKAAEMIFKGGGGHLGTTISVAEIISVLYKNILNVNPKKPNDPGRDRLVMSKGHGCNAIYVTLANLGFFPKKELDRYCQPGGILPGHTTITIPGIEASTGSLGHGLSIAVGMAKAAKLDKKDWKVFCVMSDGDCQEGSSWEAVMAAAHHQLDNLVAIVDYNNFCSFEPIDNFLTSFKPLADKFMSFGWSVSEINGHDMKQIYDTLSKTPLKKNTPSVVIAHTIKGRGISFMENQPSGHWKVLNEQEYKQILAELV